jgi:alkaline phosphatase D
MPAIKFLSPFFIFIFFTINVSSDTKIGFGSCLDQRYPQKIWKSIADENINKFIFLGDNVYGDVPSGDTKKLVKAYKLQARRFPRWLNELEKLAIWDDHDYGKNDGGSEYKHKQLTQKIFMDFWDIPSNDPRRSREGTYFSKDYIIEKNKIKVIGLDTRYFRSNLLGSRTNRQPNNDLNSSILGISQWSWLENELNDPKTEMFIILSSIQVLPTEHGYEKWANFPHEREKLINLLQRKKNVLILSGDRHRGAIYKHNKIIEITASSLNKPGSSDKETDKLMQGRIHKEINYGILVIKEDILDIQLKNNDGTILESAIMSL